jgi:hypothetical protein
LTIGRGRVIFAAYVGNRHNFETDKYENNGKYNTILQAMQNCPLELSYGDKFFISCIFCLECWLLLLIPAKAVSASLTENTLFR